MELQQSAEINELATALAVAQGDLKNVAKEKEVVAGPQKRWSYADLGDGLDEIRKVLSKHGLSFVQVTSFGGQNASDPAVIAITTQLMHKSGQWIRGSYPVCEVGLDHQSTGSAMTYSRRYTLFAFVGLVGVDDDDDGERAQQTATAGRRSAKAAPKTQPQPKATMTATEVNDSASLLHEILDRLTIVSTMEQYGNLVADINTSGITGKLTQADYATLKSEFADRRARIEGSQK